MIFTDEMMHGVFALLEQVGATREQVVSVSTVLYQGNIEQADDDDSAITHIYHASQHMRPSRDDVDEDSGWPKESHAIARLILAIERIVRDAPRTTTPDSESSD